MLLATVANGETAEKTLSIAEKFTHFWKDQVVVLGPKVFLTLVVFAIVHIIAKIVLKRLQVHLSTMVAKRQENPVEVEKRMATLFGIISKASLLAIWMVGVMVILSQLEIEIGPIIAAAGVLGLAISFGAQSLVKDFFNGMFILLENQIRVGDVALINGTGGLVEEINLRTVVLRDLYGTVHVFPNGNISSLSNMTKDWSGAILDIGVAYKEDVDRVMEVMLEVGKQLKEDENWKDKIIADMEMMGLDKFADSAVVIRARIKTRPIQQWTVGREYRRRLKRAFDEKGISIPFPHRTLYFGEASEAFQVLLSQTKTTGDLHLPSDTKQE